MYNIDVKFFDISLKGFTLLFFIMFLSGHWILKLSGMELLTLQLPSFQLQGYVLSNPFAWFG